MLNEKKIWQADSCEKLCNYGVNYTKNYYFYYLVMYQHDRP